MKKILIATAAIGAVAFASAANAGPAKSFDGPYVGAEVGAAVSSTKEVDVFGKSDLYGQGLVGGGFLGYGLTFDKFYVGAEANGSLTNLETKAWDSALEKKYGLGLAARAGYLLSPATLGYGVVGWERGRFDLKTINDASHKFWADGLRVGAGLEQGITDNVAMRGELNLVMWQGKDFRVKSDAHEINAKVGLSYRFN